MTALGPDFSKFFICLHLSQQLPSLIFELSDYAVSNFPLLHRKKSSSFSLCFGFVPHTQLALGADPHPMGCTRVGVIRPICGFRIFHLDRKRALFLPPYFPLFSVFCMAPLESPFLLRQRRAFFFPPFFKAGSGDFKFLPRIVSPFPKQSGSCLA